MTAIDFGRSFVTFVTPGRANNARIQVECRCEFSDAEAGTNEELFLVASCKSEATYAEKDLFTSPNYDFCGVFNETQLSIIRTPASAADQRPDVSPVEGRFLEVYRQIVSAPAEPLPTSADVVAATLAGKPIVARTVFGDPSGRYKCALEYPVKTMNANDIRPMYQVDTGPVPFPTFDPDVELTAGRFRLAFVAFNAPHSADFVIQTPTEIAPGVQTPHYSEIISLEATNELFALN